MAWKVEIAGVDRTADVHIASGVSWAMPFNERWTARFTTIDLLPALRAEVLIYDTNGTTVIFGGIIYRRALRTVTERANTPYLVDVECVDWSIYMDWRTITGGYVGPKVPITSSNASNPKTITTTSPHGLTTGDVVVIVGHSVNTTNGTFTATVTGGSTFTIPVAGAAGTNGSAQRLSTITLKRFMQDAIFYALGAYGITLDGAQVTGPSGASPGLSWEDKKLSEIVRDVSILSGGYLSRITPLKVWSMVLPGSVAAPFTMTTATPNFMDLVWDENNDNYATKIFLRCGGDGAKTLTQTWVLQAGQTFLMTDVPAVSGSTASATVNGSPRTIGPPGSSTHLIWTWQTHTVTIGPIAMSPALAVGDTIAISFTAQLPFTVMKDSGGSPVVERIFKAPDITEFPAADATAIALLARHNQSPRALTIRTRRTGLAPGQTLTINITAHQTNVTATITSVEATLDLDGAWVYTIQATTGTHQGSALDYFREIGSGGAGPALVLPFTAAGPSTTIVQGIAYADLGGSRNTAVAANPFAWTAAVDWVPYWPRVSGSVAVRVDLWARDAGVQAQARLWDYTTSEQVGISDGVTGTTVTPKLFTATVIVNHRYGLQITSDTNGAGVYTIGTLEAI